MFDFTIQKPTWIQVRYSANPQDLEQILQESDQSYSKKVESYLAFHARPEEIADLSREFLHQLFEDPHRMQLIKFVVRQKEINIQPVIITFDPGRDITHELQEYWNKK